MEDKTRIRISDAGQLYFLPALEKMGYRILSADEQKLVREGDETAVLLTTVLRQQLIKLNTVEINSVKEVRFSQEEVETGIKALQTIVRQGEYLPACREVYELITQGKVFRQDTGMGGLSFTMHYIDWNNPLRNVWHVAEKFCVRREEHRFYPDYVLFVNGIPLCVIEWNDVAWRGGIEMAVQQQLVYQKTEGIRDLYAYAQLLLAVAGNTVKCATNGLQAEVWAEWHDPERENRKEQALPLLFLCEPGRMLELVNRFILFQGEKKILARYYHYFIVKKILEQIGQLKGQRREGGLVYQPAGSGKALTMLLLTRAIRRNKQIRNPKIFWVTDRVTTSRQSAELLVKCGLPFIDADTGRSLASLLQSDLDGVVTTTLQKFLTAANAVRTPLESTGIFVILEEGQRSQLGKTGYRLSRILPDACFIVFTNVPVTDEWILQRWGKLIATYPVGKAIEDKVLLPVLYEGRHLQEEICDEKKRIEKTGEDIAADFECHYKDTDLKGLVICRSQQEAMMYKAVFDRIGKLSAEIVPGRKKEEGYVEKVSVREKTELLRRFQEEATPVILIISERGLSGFDVSCDVLYLVSQVPPGSYLQMASRLSRGDKTARQGRLIDYQSFGEGIFGKLEAVGGKETGTWIQSVETVFYHLDQIHTEVRKILGGMPGYCQDLRKWGDRFRDVDQRIIFYTRLDNYEKELRKIAGDCSCEEREEKIKRYTADYQCFVRLKHILLRRFAEQLPEEDPVVQVLPDKMLAWAVMADPSVFQQEMKEAGGLLARADTLAYRMKRGVEFSDSLELVYRGKVLKVLDGIWACYEQNGDKREYFDRVTGLRLRLLNDMQVEKLPGDSVLSAYRGVLQKLFIGEEKAGAFIGQVALETDRIVRKNIYEAGKLIVDWQRKETLINRLKRELVDYLIVFLAAEGRKEISYEEIYGVVEQCVGKAVTGNYENE